VALQGQRQLLQHWAAGYCLAVVSLWKHSTQRAEAQAPWVTRASATAAGLPGGFEGASKGLRRGFEGAWRIKMISRGILVEKRL
jgi:hypothetical protein